ncbi:MAG: tRNA lysidine(34) synthetase TilS [Oligoflexales bacterium]|nr:tRNA lysidine(34) synthetase TilS [Oligoflexales bacterium]
MLGFFGSDLIGLAEKMDAALERFKEQYQAVAVACSGGVDSTALFHLLLALTKRKKNFPLAICHTNFGLRGNESDADQKFLENLAAEKKVSIFVHQAEKKELQVKQTGGTQQWAREVRYKEFERLSKEGWLIALAHHQDDLAENIILRMARGTSAGAMAGMQEWNPPYWRPLLTVTKGMLEAWLDRHQLLHREDSSNDKMDYSRNVIRHQILPQLEELFPGAKRRIARCGMDAWDLGQACQKALSSEIAAVQSDAGVPVSWFLEKGEAMSIQALSAIIGPLKKNRNSLNHHLLRKIWDLIEVSAHKKKSGSITLPADGGYIEVFDGFLRHNPAPKAPNYQRVKQHESSYQPYEAVTILGPKSSTTIQLPTWGAGVKKHRVLSIENMGDQVMAISVRAPRAAQKLRFPGSSKDWSLKELMTKNNIPSEAKRDMFICTEFLPNEAKTNMVSLGIFWKGGLVRPDPKGHLKCVKENIAVHTFEH